MRKIIHLLLVLPILWMFHNRMANWHFHELPNGILIEHAHPYEKLPGASSEKHNHTPFDFFILDLIYNAVFFIIALAAFYKLFQITFQLLNEADIEQFFPSLNYGFPSLRAPPSV
jgi:hypothetical protein